MKITASIENGNGTNSVTVATEGNARNIVIPPKPDGKGSSVNGGELLFLSLATCFCNDVYREASRRKMNVLSVDVEVTGEFGKEGEPGNNITYRVNVVAPDHSPEEIRRLILDVDNIAEIHNTLRKGTSVSLQY